MAKRPAGKLRADEAIECDAIHYGQRRDFAGLLRGLSIFCWAIGPGLAAGAILGGQLQLLVGLLPAIAVQLISILSKRREDLGAGEVRVDEHALHLDGDRRGLRVDRRRLLWGAARDQEVDFETREGRRVTLKLRRRKDVARLLEATGSSARWCCRCAPPSGPS